ncbi:MAG: CxxxxCH/CxxCH domain-containing protein [Anaeromyxobacteraceae bacterium]
MYLVAGTALVGCGSNVPQPEATPAVEAAPAPAPAPAAPPAPGATPAGALPAAATTCSPLLGHAAYTAQTCESCHPCGAKATSGHPAAWTDRTSPGFHAYSANAGIANCRGCHGAALDGVGGTAKTACSQCHGATWKTNCVMCHGGTDNQTGAPPRTTWGNTADATRVGTHTAHVAATHGLAAAVACATCHVVPTDALAAGHVDGGTSEVTFSGRAIQGTTTAAWTRATATCSNTYCHGATLKGGTVTAPVWTQTNGTARACNACHGAPPPAPHSTSTACGSCHTGYTATTVNAATHMNGVLDVTGMTCTSCHGNAAQTATQAAPLYAAPPAGTKGETATTTRAVGAHQAHLTGTRLRSTAIACTQCHAVPASTSHANSVVDLAWGTLATKSGAVAATWNGTALTCTNYCHGTGVSGGTTKSPTWTGGASQANTCTSCHGAPPPAPHSTSTACASCHTGYTATTVNLATHMNGVVDAVAMTCTSCHGTATRAATALNPQLAAAPPVDTTGATATTVRGVGAHMKHLSTATRSLNFACTECHQVPTSMSHANGVKDVTFGTLAKTGNKTPTYNATTTGCSATYCHGNFTNGKTTAAPLWTGGALACNACHNMPNTMTGRHSTHFSSSFNCSECHNGIATGTTATNAAIGGATLHVNGVVNVVFTPTLTFTSTGSGTSRRCNGTCHGKSHSNLSW